jgi:hypothetical protein
MINKTILLLISDGLMRSAVTETLEKAGYVVVSTGLIGFDTTRHLKVLRFSRRHILGRN